jgi:hypothetical protein
MRKVELSSTFRILGSVAGEVDQAVDQAVGGFLPVPVGAGHGGSLVGP